MKSEIRHFHLFCGLGGGAAGFNRGHARVGSLEARFRCIGGVDSDPAAISDFERLAGVPGTVLDLFSREQYTAFHGHEPPSDWRETDRLAAQIIAEDDTWHRPFTTLELAALQGLVDPEEHLELEGLSDSAWRERIGNAVPPPAAEAIASVMGQTLLLAWSGETFVLSNQPIWVRPIAMSLSLPRGTFQ